MQIYSLVQIFKEYETFTKHHGATSLENSQIVKSVLPLYQAPITFNKDMHAKAEEAELMARLTFLDFTDNNRAEDKRLKGQRKKDSKVQVQGQNMLCVKDTHTQSIDQYTSTAHQALPLRTTRTTLTYDSLTPSFQVFQPVHLPL